MSPVDRDEFSLGSYEKFQPGFRRDEKRPKILVTSSGAIFEKPSKYTETQKNLTFAPIITSATLKAVVNARRCHPDCQNLSCFHPGKRAEVFSWQNFQSAYRDLGWKNREDLGNPANRVHVKRPKDLPCPKKKK